MLLSLHSEEKPVHQSSSTAAERRQLKFESNTWCIKNLWISLYCFLFSLRNWRNISLLLTLYAPNPYPQNCNFYYCFYFLGIRSFNRLLHSIGMQLYNIFQAQINHLNLGYQLIPSTSQSSFGSLLYKSTWHSILTRSRDAQSDMK